MHICFYLSSYIYIHIHRHSYMYTHVCNIITTQVTHLSLTHTHTHILPHHLCCEVQCSTLIFAGVNRNGVLNWVTHVPSICVGGGACQSHTEFMAIPHRKKMVKRGHVVQDYSTSFRSQDQIQAKSVSHSVLQIVPLAWFNYQ